MAKAFTRSLPAQAAALSVINAAKEHGYLKGPLVADPVLAEAEKELFLAMLKRLADRRRTGGGELTSDEISSLFTFVFARAAEAVTNMVNRQPNKFELLGMFDGKVPISADERLIGAFKKLELPSDCARAYWTWYHDGADAGQRSGVDPVLPLFEALKWTFRISCTVAIEKLEELGIRL